MSGIQSTGSSSNVHSSTPARSRPAAAKAEEKPPVEPRDEVRLSASEEPYQRRSNREILRALRGEQPPELSQDEKIQNLQDYNRRMLEDYTRGR